MSQPNPKDSMKSTWRRDKSQWSIPHKIFERVNVYHVDIDREVPVHDKSDKVPYVSDISMNRWVLVHACVPMMLHQL
ncbi:hypothetical protein LTS12_029349, partial [Elasticomyces elasticus]